MEASQEQQNGNRSNVKAMSEAREKYIAQIVEYMRTTNPTPMVPDIQRLIPDLNASTVASYLRVAKARANGLVPMARATSYVKGHTITIDGVNYFTTMGMARYLGISPAAPVLWMTLGLGPKYEYRDVHGNGGSARLYRESEVIRWREAHPPKGMRKNGATVYYGEHHQGFGDSKKNDAEAPKKRKYTKHAKAVAKTDSGDTVMGAAGAAKFLGMSRQNFFNLGIRHGTPARIRAERSPNYTGGPIPFVYSKEDLSAWYEAIKSHSVGRGRPRGSKNKAKVHVKRQVRVVSKSQAKRIAAAATAPKRADPRKGLSDRRTTNKSLAEMIAQLGEKIATASNGGMTKDDLGQLGASFKKMAEVMERSSANMGRLIDSTERVMENTQQTQAVLRELVNKVLEEAGEGTRIMPNPLMARIRAVLGLQ